MPEKLTEVSESQLRVAFDGDAVLFSDESERIFKAHGLDKFFEHERENEDTLLDHVCTSCLTSVSVHSPLYTMCISNFTTFSKQKLKIADFGTHTLAVCTFIFTLKF